MKIRFIIAFFCFCIAFATWTWPWGNSLKKEYRSAILTAGEGLGDIKIGTIDIETFVKKVGFGELLISAGDYGYAYEFFFDEFRTSFFFKIPSACIRLFDDTRKLSTLKNNSENFFRTYPGCKNVTLSSIFVSKGFRGNTPQNTKIGDPLFEQIGYGEVDTSGNYGFSAGPTSFLKGSDNWQSLSFDSGIRLYYTIGKKDGKDNLLIQGMTIYKPGDTDERIMYEPQDN